jgi:hypothetical protein
VLRREAKRTASLLLSACPRRAFFPLAFAILALPLGLLLATVTPLGGVVDETAHAAKAESLSAGELFGHRGQSYWYDLSVHTTAGFDVDATFLTAHEVYTLGKVTAADVAQAMDRRWAHQRIYVEAAFPARYFPVFYVPPALAIDAAKLAGASPYAAFRDARLANLAAFAALGMAALIIARRGRALLFCVLSLPMTLSLAGSINQDGVLIACSALAAAFLMRVVDDPDAAGAGRHRAIAALLVGMIALAKLPYIPLAALLLLPLPCAWRNLPPRLGLALLSALPALAWGAYAMSRISVPWPLTPAYAPGPLWPGPAGQVFHSLDPAAQLRVLTANPLLAVSLTVRTLLSDTTIWPSTVGDVAIGGILLPGIVLSTWTVAFATAGAAAILDDTPRPGVRLRWLHALVVLIMLFAALIGIYMSQYLTWTRVGYDHVDLSGQEGRYLVPLIPALALGLPVLRGPRLGVAALLLFIPAGAAALISMGVVPRVVIEAFYLR